jgi:hypothetical protein
LHTLTINSSVAIRSGKKGNEENAESRFER